MSESMFEYGDQDYGSAVGWDPDKRRLEKLTEEAKKKYPKAFSPQPEMLFVRSAEECVTTAAEWDPMKQLFGPLWLQEEVAVLYSTPGVGKTALAVQIAESLARGLPMAPFDKPMPGCEVPPQRVLYIDFEMTLPQFSRRYSTTSGDGLKVENPYRFSPNFLRAEMFWDGRLIDGYEDFTDMLFTDIGNVIDEHRTEVLICDNITFLSRSSTASATIAFRLMNRLQELKRSRFLSILAVAHTPKRRPHLPLTERDLQGSIDIAKVADSMFALGASTLGPDIRYVKQIKSRSGRIEHDGGNVLVYRLGKFDLAAEARPAEKAARADNFFGFSFIGKDNELDHLPAPFRPPPADRRPKLDRSRVAYAKLLARQGLSTADIGRRLGVSKPTAHRYITKGGQDARLT
ncbi:MAG: AAA family ATPase [Pyrinomonadaceae bacterium]